MFAIISGALFDQYYMYLNRCFVITSAMPRMDRYYKRWIVVRFSGLSKLMIH